MVQISNVYLAAFKKDDSFVIYEDDENLNVYYVFNLKTKLGNFPIRQAIVSNYTNLPIVVNDLGITALRQTESVYTGDDVFTSLSDNIAPKLSILKDKENIKTHNHKW